MLIFDQLKKNDPQLRIVAVIIGCGLIVLMGGLWWVQIVSARDYQENLRTQSYRTVRIPAVRGKILDRNGDVLAENRATYNVSLYFDELRPEFDKAASAKISSVRKMLKQQKESEEKRLDRSLNKVERKKYSLTLAQQTELRRTANYEVASNVVFQISGLLKQPEPYSLNATNFRKHYEQQLYLPFPVFTNLNSTQIALFEEQCTSPAGVDIEMQSTRVYPRQTAAAHVIGSVQHDDSSAEGEDAFFSYRLPDYAGKVGVEAGYDKQLRGKAGVKSVVVNNLGYRQTENVWTPAEPGHNVFLTIDLQIQTNAERALRIEGPTTRGAAVVMDVETGDILAMVSSPAFDPNVYVRGISKEDYKALGELTGEKNRATQENYAPGSIFKMVVGMTCLERGINPAESIYNPGHIYVGRRKIGDLALPGNYDFKLALMHSSNTYFISNGMRSGIDNIIKMAQHIHLGERSGLNTRQDVSGMFPTLVNLDSDWHDGDTANICIGQGKMAVTPLQMTVMIAAIANGGKVLWPRLVDRIESLDAPPGTPPAIFERGRIRDHLPVSAKNLQVIREAMLADVESPGGTGVKAAVPGFPQGGKTGTAQVMDEHNRLLWDNTWFASFAPYDKPRYAMVILVEHGKSGGGTCAPIAQQIYKAIIAREHANSVRTNIIARAE